MRRRAGADSVDLDTIKGYAHFAYHSPRKIDLVAIQRAAHDAAYTIKTMQVELQGTVVTAPCKPCGKESRFLKLDQTGQLLEIRGGPDVGSHGTATLSTNRWGRDKLGTIQFVEHVIFEVESFAPTDAR